MSEIYELTAEIRTQTGKGASRRLRRMGEKLPAIIYGGEKEPVMLNLPVNVVRKALSNEAFYSHILTLSIEGKKEKAVLKDLQRHPARGDVMHMDFLRVTGKEALTMRVPLHFLNEDSCPGVKAGGIVSHTMVDLEIKCLPKDLPEFIEVDLANLELDHAVHLSDLKLPQGVEMTAHVDSEHDAPVASVHIPHMASVDDEESSDAAGDEKAAGSEAGEDKEGSDSSSDSE